MDGDGGAKRGEGGGTSRGSGGGGATSVEVHGMDEGGEKQVSPEYEILRGNLARNQKIPNFLPRRPPPPLFDPLASSVL